MKVNGQKIKKLREKLNIARVDLALAADLGERRIQQVEDALSINMNLNIAKAVAQRLGVRLEAIAK